VTVLLVVLPVRSIAVTVNARVCEGPQLRAERLLGRDQHISQLAQTVPLGVDRAFACGHQRLAFAACPCVADRFS